jgi:predicted dinucleotide-binding enzyme
MYHPTNYTVIGAGNGGKAMAAHLALGTAELCCITVPSIISN